MHANIIFCEFSSWGYCKAIICHFSSNLNYSRLDYSFTDVDAIWCQEVNIVSGAIWRSHHIMYRRNAENCMCNKIGASHRFKVKHLTKTVWRILVRLKHKYKQTSMKNTDTKANPNYCYLEGQLCDHRHCFWQSEKSVLCYKFDVWIKTSLGNKWRHMETVCWQHYSVNNPLICEMFHDLFLVWQFYITLIFVHWK